MRGRFANAVLWALLLGACSRDPLSDGLPQVSCTSCHGNADNAAPPSSVWGRKSTTDIEVGAHQLHLRDSPLRKAIACNECHVVPKSVDEHGHIPRATAENPAQGAQVVFGTLASARGAQPAWNRGAVACASVYCHGATLKGGVQTTPSWTFDRPSTTNACTRCHGNPPPPPHPASTQCVLCHPKTVKPDGSIDVDGGFHINGQLDVAGQGCSVCHGGPTNAAPPRGLSGETATSARAVGAHQQHLKDGSIRRAIACADCHIVPTEVGAAGHIDTPAPAELVWSTLATQNGKTAPVWNGKTCASVYCHGSTLKGGTAKSPEWTKVDGSQSKCDSCHGNPPPAPHPASTDCALCHPKTVKPDGSIDVAGGFHINGQLEASSQACNACHGGTTSAAPPKGLLGETATTTRAVGAHQQHLQDGNIRKAIACTECHLVPADVGSVGHIDSASPAELTWGALATQSNSKPVWDGKTCASTYCHGATLKGGVTKSPLWTKVDGTQAACDSCHGFPPPAPHVNDSKCWNCHPGTVKVGGLIDVAGGLHINGKLDVVGGACGGCHAVPPATGAHVAHYGDTSSPPLATYGDLRALETYYPAGKSYYMFGCGNCHPLDAAKHMNGTVEVELYNAASTASSLKAKNPASAAYASGVCSNTYCHSSGQAAPQYKNTPAWSSGQKTTCSSCHDNPPRYSSGGAGSATANSHLVLADDNYLFGHFAGLPGAWHMTPNRHGEQPGTSGAAAMTCQTCHFSSVDAASTGPSGFYWLDTSGQYNLPGAVNTYSCTTCHTGAAGKPPAKEGKAAPLRHVNGQRDVVFDTRTTLPSYAGLPQGANTPSRPYWISPASITWTNPDVGKNGVSWSLHLQAASYNAATKTCNNVVCHLEEKAVVWGVTPVGMATCNNCHKF